MSIWLRRVSCTSHIYVIVREIQVCPYDVLHITHICYFTFKINQLLFVIIYLIIHVHDNMDMMHSISMLLDTSYHGYVTIPGGGGGYSHKWPIWVCAAPNPPLFTLTRSQTPHYLPWSVRWTPIFLSLSVRSPHKIYRDSFVHRELWNYLSLVGNWLFRTLVFGLKMSQIAPHRASK